MSSPAVDRAIGREISGHGSPAIEAPAIDRAMPLGTRYPKEASSRRRFFIVSAGRTGSTLLAAVLADCGADFALPRLDEWDPGSGAMEHRGMHSASGLMKRAYEIGVTRPAPGYRRLVWNTLRSIGKHQLDRALDGAKYLKGANADLVVQPAFKLGYFPSVILSYRRFEDMAVSNFLRKGASSFEALLADYRRVYRNGLLLLSVFGGCVVGFEQLVDLQDVSWASALAAVTGIDATRLIRAQSSRLAASSRPVEVRQFDPAAQEIFERIDALRGREIMPSDQVLRYARRKLNLVPMTASGPSAEPRAARSDREPGDERSHENETHG